MSIKAAPHLKTAAWLAAALVVVVAIHAVDSDRHSVILGGLRNAGHLPLFGLLSLALVMGLQHTRRPFLYTAATCAAIAVVAEFSQLFSGGEVDWRDACRDAIGAALFLSAYWLLQRRPRGSGATLLAVSLMLASLLPAAYWASQWWLRDSASPCLLAANWNWTPALVKPLHAALAKTDDADALLEMRLEQASFAGLVLTDPITDWSGYQFLSFSAFAADGIPGELTLRVHDRAHTHEYADRFNRTWLLDTAPARFRISLDEIRQAPAGRTMDLREISELRLFRRAASADQRIRLGAICLEQ